MTELDRGKASESAVGEPVKSQTETTFQKLSEAPVTLSAGQTPITPWEYQKLLGKGMDVDWCKTSQGKEFYNVQKVIDFKNAGVQHVRIRIKDKSDGELMSILDKQINDCLSNGLIPVIAYQADEFKNEPSQENIDKMVK